MHGGGEARSGNGKAMVIEWGATASRDWISNLAAADLTRLLMNAWQTYPAEELKTWRICVL